MRLINEMRHGGEEDEAEMHAEDGNSRSVCSNEDSKGKGYLVKILERETQDQIYVSESSLPGNL